MSTAAEFIEFAREALAAAFADSGQPDGSYRQDNVFRYLIAQA